MTGGMLVGGLRAIVDRGRPLGTGRLHGGSVTANNARELLAQPDVDGALVGGACFVTDSLLAIVAAARGCGRPRGGGRARTLRASALPSAGR